MSLSRLRQAARRVKAATRRLLLGIRPFRRVFLGFAVCVLFDRHRRSTKLREVTRNCFVTRVDSWMVLRSFEDHGYEVL